MLVITHRKNVEISAAGGQANRAVNAVPMILGFLRKTIVKSGKLLARIAQVFAEARVQRAILEAELYQRRYKHSSKNDDDLPIVR